jgi:hypothetical protein
MQHSRADTYSPFAGSLLVHHLPLKYHKRSTQVVGAGEIVGSVVGEGVYGRGDIVGRGETVGSGVGNTAEHPPFSKLALQQSWTLQYRGVTDQIFPSTQAPAPFMALELYHQYWQFGDNVGDCVGALDGPGAANETIAKPSSPPTFSSPAGGAEVVDLDVGAEVALVTLGVGTEVVDIVVGAKVVGALVAAEVVGAGVPAPSAFTSDVGAGVVGALVGDKV